MKLAMGILLQENKKLRRKMEGLFSFLFFSSTERERERSFNPRIFGHGILERDSRSVGSG